MVSLKYAQREGMVMGAVAAEMDERFMESRLMEVLKE